MPLISKKNRFTDISPQTLLSTVTKSSGLFLPSSLRKAAFNHYRDSAGERFGFSLQPPWEALPSGEWKVHIVKEKSETDKRHFQIEVSSLAGKLFSAALHISINMVDEDSEITINIDGKHEAGLDGYSDELVETIIRSMIRESFTQIEQLLASDGESSIADEAEQDTVHHIAPLAVAAGVFSAGMALGLWFWRRKKKDGES